ncbi:DUF2075 domain-containing protein [Lactobacillus sp. PV037]|uniref:DUF2075 domain-containing protein n=1 Tax=unclassified Lactobacillus TaxID=2620435 RepID=UPI0022408BAB|nr:MULTISPECIES: DUF2075 domain-containing protein [unclassified Lactobacillus]QNQ82276.1 DUF2075 domain-containing protein [Lactobacillus sp. PV012]QNQ83613.1 DUF2075 domain-containing protein [Lactobacillus sp. PV037]
MKEPIIYQTKYNLNSAVQLKDAIRKEYGNHSEKSSILTEYPTVYIINDTPNQHKDNFSVYVGETNDIQRRTLQHLDVDPKNRQDFSNLKRSRDTMMYVIGHQHFNKSMTLDIENRLMQYLSSVPAVKHLNNRRHNEQNKYYDSHEFDELFDLIWKKLNKENKTLFPAQSILESSALFKSSPFNKLTTEQLNAKEKIIDKINFALTNANKQLSADGELILVKGEAGAGKTVLMSNIFYDLVHETETQNDKHLSISLLVNQNEQLTVYQEMKRKLFEKQDHVTVEKPVSFIKNVSPDDKTDIVLVDEVHLLLTQRSQSYAGLGQNMLEDILKRAKIVMAVYDPKQVLSTTSVWEDGKLEELEQKIGPENIIYLHNQMRIDANPQTINWIENIINYGKIGKLPKDNKYEVKVFSDPAKMQAAIKNKDKNQERGISRMVATFDWKYSGGKAELPAGQKYWEVVEGSWKMPWNYEIRRRDGYEKHNHPYGPVTYKQQAWAEKDYTINEIGSTYTVQGFDLNYVGVELGPSVKYRDGKLIHDPSSSKNSKATQKRNSTKSYAEMLLKNELNVLLTRGVHGLYLHAVDPALQKALEKAVK